MAISNDIDKINVAVCDKVREYYKIDKKLGGLIKTSVSVHLDNLGREINIFIPTLDQKDEIYINGTRFVPTQKEQENE